MRSQIAYLPSLTRLQKRMVLISVDAVMFCASALFVSLISGVLQYPDALTPAALGALAGIAIIMVTGGYNTVIRYMNASALLGFASAALAAALVWAFAANVRNSPIVATAPLLYGLLVFLGICLPRHTFRLMARKLRRNRVSVAIYGAGVAGRQLVAAIADDPNYRPVVFIDDDPALSGMFVSGLKVFPAADAAQVLRQHRVEQIFFAIPSASGEARRKLLSRLSELRVKVKAIPALSGILSGEIGQDLLRPVEMEDILSRDPIAAEPALLRANVTEKTIMVTGAGGSIGSELCRTILHLQPTALVLLEFSEPALYEIEQELQNLVATMSPQLRPQLFPILGNVNDAALLNWLFASYSVDTVFHAAAYKHVPLVELNPVEGVRNNVLGTRTLVEEVLKAKVSTFVMISTDKAVRPTNLMGASKRLAEMIVQVAGETSECKMSIVRFGNVLGSSGSVLPLFKAQIAKGGPITVTHPEVTRFFMTIPEAAQLVVQAGTLGGLGSVFHLDMGEPIRILELARRLLNLYGLTERTPDGRGDIEISIVGLRPGEKLYEELLIDPGARATSHPRIFVAKEGHLDCDQLAVILHRLEAACNILDEDEVLDLLTETVEGFKPYSRQQINMARGPRIANRQRNARSLN